MENKYFIVEDECEHRCCFDVAICRKYEEGEYNPWKGINENKKIQECIKKDAQFICDSMNIRS